MNKTSFKKPLILLSTLFLVGCNSNHSKNSESSESKEEEYATFTLNEYNERLSFHTEKQDNYFLDTYDRYDPYTGSGAKDESKSIPIEISFDVETNIENPTYRFIYQEEGEDNSKVVETKEKSVSLINLKLDTTYNYHIELGDFKSDEGTFMTTNIGLRNMNVASLSNFRDLGGLLRSDGKRINQGLIYRSAGLNEAYTQNITVSDEDIKYLKEELNIKTEIDLRNDQETSKGVETGLISSSPLGEDVNYYLCPMLYGGSNVLTKNENQEGIKSFFNYLGDESNYPMIFHCSQGKDRTGGLAYVIEALLGVSHEDMMRDYLFTNFSDAGLVKKDGIEGAAMIYGILSRYESGETLQEKTYNYLVNETGIPSQTLDKIIDILG